jgi:thioredoxin 1
MAVQVNFDTPIVSNDQSFDRVLKAGLPVAALFWNGSKLDSGIENELNLIARAEAGKLLVVKIKTADNPDLTRRYDLRGGVTLITLRESKELTRVENPTPGVLREHVNYLLGRGPQPAAPAAEPRPSYDTGSRSSTPPAGSSYAAAAKPVTTTDASFARDVMQSPIPVVVDFWAPWCGSCRMVAPVLEKMAAEYGGRLRIVKLNVDENPQTGMQYQVQGIPTMLFVKNGQVVNRVVGALPEPRLREQVEKLLRV